jgi:hypothetical protein
MGDYENQEWVTLYRAALSELEHAKMSGRIEATRTAIASRIEKLQHMPGLHPDERQAIADALSGLHALQAEDEQYDADRKRHAVEMALQKLRSVGPRILNNQNEGDSNRE